MFLILTKNIQVIFGKLLTNKKLYVIILYRKEVNLLKDYELYLSSLYDKTYYDGEQNYYDYDDQYQGCPDYAEYMKEWN